MRIDLVIVAAALLFTTAPAQESARPADRAYVDRVRPFLARHCQVGSPGTELEFAL